LGWSLPPTLLWSDSSTAGATQKQKQALQVCAGTVAAGKEQYQLGRNGSSWAGTAAAGQEQ